MLSVPCCCHSAVLVIKPPYRDLDDLPSQLVRLSHCLESGRTATDFMEALAREIADHFCDKEVIELPCDAPMWREQATRYITLSRPAQDLSLADEEHLLACVNDDWSSVESIIHWCVRGRCPLACGGSADASKAMVTSALVNALGGPMVVPLLYRWKGFEKAAAWALRGRRCHNLLARAFRRLFPASTVRKAQEEAARTAAGEHVSLGVKQQIRAGPVPKSMERGPQRGWLWR